MLLQLVSGILLVFFLFIGRIRKRGAKPGLPPGPRRHFLLGNILDLPTEYEWKSYMKWSETYESDVVSASALGMNIVTFNSYAKAMEALDKKSNVYSSRPVLPFVCDVMGCGVTFGLLPYGPTLRNTRKMVNQELGSVHAMRGFSGYQQVLTRRLAVNLLDRPGDFWDHIISHSEAIVMKIVYDYDVQDAGDPLIANAYKALTNMFEGAHPMRFLVNLIPAMKHIPEWVPWYGKHFKTVAREWRKDYDIHVDTPFDMVKEKMALGTAEESFVHRWLRQADSKEGEAECKHAAGAMFGAGGETSAIALHTFICMMVLHPDIQNKAQEELDSVIGSDRLPLCEDRNQLPYIEALCKEVLRYHPPLPLNLPHCTTEDDIHDGYFIPKATIVWANAWRMGRDPRVYTNPEDFNPSRFLGPSPEQFPREYVFGFGRRVCPGLRLAETTLFMGISTILLLFDIKPLEDGEPPMFKTLSGMTSHVERISCSIAPRKGEAYARDFLSQNHDNL